MTTKPYISGAAYINKMSDYCRSCAFDPRKNCPITSLYWSFLHRKREHLEGNRRLALPLANAAKRDEAKQAQDHEVFRRVRETLARGARCSPSDKR